jgi:lyzozyme M1 (1,4-beta-N-acetylmuramidase)
MISLFIIIGFLAYLLIDNMLLLDNSVVKDKKFVLEVHKKEKLSNVLKLEEKILDDRELFYEEIGEKKISFIYLNKNKKKRKAEIKLNIVDTIKPLVFGANYFKSYQGVKKDFTKNFLILDNYDREVKKVVENDIDFDKLGKYKLILKATDNSNNITIKEFTVEIVEKPKDNKETSKTVKRVGIKYEDIYTEYKNNKTKIGIDISKWQGNVDFQKLKEANVEFVMIRLGYQTGFGKELVLDKYYEQNIKLANKYGIKAGVYFYSYAKNTNDAKKQAEFVKKHIKDYKIDMPIAFDFEDWKNIGLAKLSIYDINKNAKTFLDEIKKDGYQVLNYGSKYYLENIWDIDYPTWLAHYTGKTNYSKDYKMWQLTENGLISGIQGFVDVNVLYE